MPRKIRDLISDLKHAGFMQFPARGSHRKFKHATGVVVVLSGHSEGDGAKPYQEKQVRLVIEEVSR